MNDKTVVQINKLSYDFQDEDKSTEVLRNISFEVQDGEFFTILGPSGCGKSTLLRLLAGVIPALHGKIFWREDLRLSTAMIFQSFALFPWLTVYENVEFGLKMEGIKKKERAGIVEEHIKEIGLAGFEHTFPKDLSGGMKQRVGIARALAVSPKVLFMDEAFSSLDAFTAEKLRKEVLGLWLKDKLTTVMVTHSVEEAIQMADRVLVMTPGPGGVEAMITIDLPRPRNKRSEEFFKLVDKINESVKV